MHIWFYKELLEHETVNNWCFLGVNILKLMDYLMYKNLYVFGLLHL